MNLIENIEEHLELSKRDKKYLNINKKYKDLCKTFDSKEKGKEWIDALCNVSLKMKHLLTQPFILWDTETTGISSQDEIIELGILSSDNSRQFNELFKPLIPISEAAQRVHHISNEDVKDKPSIESYWHNVMHLFLDYKQGVAYNGQFDERMMKQTLFNHQLPDIKLPTLYDPIIDMALWCGNWNKKYNSFKYLKLEGGHRALDDCHQLLKCMQLVASLDIERLQHEHDEQ